MKALRTATLAIALLIPITAIAAPIVRACCSSPTCCPGCPDCPSKADQPSAR